MSTKLAQTLQSFERQEEERSTTELAASLQLPYVNLTEYPILSDVLALVPQEEAEDNHVVPYLRVGTLIRVATDRPTNPQLSEYLRTLANRTKLRIGLAVCSASSFAAAQAQRSAQPVSANVDRILTKITGGESNLVKTERSAPTFDAGLASLKTLGERVRQVNTSELLDVLFSGAVATGATDIHLEPKEGSLRVRFRIDGVLLDVADLPTEAYKALDSRVKYLAKLKLDILSLPQDGRFSYTIGAEEMDVRTSSVPGIYGEIFTLRILPHKKNFLSLEDLGFSEAQLTIVADAMHKPNGIILSTGPTGSGKTTTLYALLEQLNKPSVKIMTLEDPVEYRLEGIDQSQVNATGDYTFAKGLRSSLRQDPDILMVGEIRDGETATTAVEAAMTGHLVLSTLHTNDAPTAVPRMLEMGVKPFLLSGVINLIIAQRLVRRICSVCKGTGKTGAGECENCHATGYKGRLAIAELMVPNRAIEDLIVQQGSAAAFAEAAKTAGMPSMADDGYAKVAQGLTDEKEIVRVTGTRQAPIASK